jgi:predicted SAM-dependent methyltransferase
MIKRTLKKIAKKMAELPIIGRFFKIAIAVIRLPESRYSEIEQNHHQNLSISALTAQLEILEEIHIKTILDRISDVNSRITESQNFISSAPSSLRNLAREVSNLNSHDETLSQSVNYLLGRVEFVRRELMFELQYGSKNRAFHNGVEIEKSEIIQPQKLELARKNKLKLNLGSGHVPLEGFINIDQRKLPGVDIVSGIERLPFQSGEVDEIFSSHVIEHFPQEQLRRDLLPYFFSLLKPGGQLRSVVPDAQAMIDAYQSGEYSFSQLKEVTFGGQDYYGDFHYNMLTPEIFSNLLQEAGFHEIQVIANNRVNGGCREFEISAIRPHS